MVSIDDMKDLTMYKRPFFLPINPKDKKHGSEIMLLTPNYQSSINVMRSPYLINRRYFESYYLEKNVFRYISSKGTFEEPVEENYIFEADLTTQERKNLPDSAFGLPDQRRYPMPDKQHVLMAIRFFNHVEEEYEAELAKNIIKKIKEFDMKDEVNVSEKNRFYPYWKKSDVYHEASLLESSIEDVDFDYYFSDELLKKFNNTVNMAEIEDTAINESTINGAEIRRHASVIITNRKGELLVMMRNDGILTIPGCFLSGDDPTGIKSIQHDVPGLFDIEISELKELYKFTYSDYLPNGKDAIVTDTVYRAVEYTGTPKNRTPKNLKWIKFMSPGQLIDSSYPKSKSLLRFMAQYGKKTMKTSIDYTTKRLGPKNNIIYQGYESDIMITSQFINANTLGHNFDLCNIKYPSDNVISIIVSRATDDYGYIDDMNVTVLAKQSFEQIYSYEYKEYLDFISCVFAYHTINPMVLDSIVYPLAMYKCGIVENELDKRKYFDRYELERVFRYIDETYGDKEIKRIVKANDLKAVIKYAAEYSENPDPIKEAAYIREIKTLLESEEEEKVAEVPSLEDLSKLGEKITRRIKNATVYKLNKIKRDMERGNTGVESRNTTTLTRLKSGNVVNTTTTQPTAEPTSESFIDWLWLDENAVIDDDVIYFLEDVNYDKRLKDALYQDRIRNNKQIVTIYKKVKSDYPSIKYTYTDIGRYDGKNLFFDLSYYNESYFKNVYINQEKNTIRDFNVYFELLKRLISDTRFSSYKKKTIFIPVLDWRHNKSVHMWMYREDINPISIIYNMIKTKPNELKSLFEGMDVIFMGPKNYFKVNFSNIEWGKGGSTQKFITLIKRIVDLGYNSPADPDPEDEPQNTASGIAMDIIDKVEKSQNINIKNVEPALKAKTTIKIENPDLEPKKVISDPGPIAIKKVNSNVTKSTPDITITKSTDTEKVYLKNGNTKEKTVKIDNKSYTVATTPEDKEKATKISKPSVNNAVNAPDKEKQKDELVKAIAKAAEGSSTSDEAMEKLEDDDFKELLAILNAEAEENVRVNKARASRIAQLSEEFQTKEVNGKSVKDLLKEDPNDKKLPETKLPIASINDDWNHMTFMNFDKLYDPDSDIVKMLDNMKNWSYPISVRNIEVTDNSTSEDLLNLWTIDCEDFKGTRFKLKVDIPIFLNDKFLLLRGNKKSLMIQSTLAPIIKTDLDTCQIIGIGGYNKIFVRRYGSNIGKSLPTTNKLIKALNKFKSDKIKIVYGDNTKICGKYELPIDYIDLAGYYDRIESGQYVFYFNQDELRKEYVVDDSKGIPIGIRKNVDIGNKSKSNTVMYYGPSEAQSYRTLSGYISNMLISEYAELADIYSNINNTGIKYTYSKASILSEKIPLVLVCAYVEGLTSVLKKAHIDYSFKSKLDSNDRRAENIDYIPFSDGYLIYEVTYSSSLLMNGLKEFDTMGHSLKEINSKKMYMEFLSQYGALKTDGLENSYDCMIDPITKEILEIYKLPTDYVSVLLHANNLLADNKFVKHTDMSARRLRRKELIAGYFYKALSGAYQSYANQIRHSRRSVKMVIKQSAVIDMILSKDPSTNDLSINNVINDVECANTITNKGLVGMNNDRAYSLDKRGYDDSMLNVIAMSTGFSGNVGVNRQATINCSIEGSRGFVKPIDNDTSKMSAANTLCISEAITPFGSTHDDPFRTLMTYVQTSKHEVRCTHNDPLLVTNGADEAMPYLASDIFAYKAKKNGKVVEIVTNPSATNLNNYMVVEYDDGTHDIVNLAETVEKNSDGGYYVPLKLDTDLKVGQRVKAGSVLAYDKKSFSNSLGESGNIALNVGTLAKVGILNTDEGYEDSAACTEEFTKKLGTEVIMAKEVVVDKNANVFLQKKIGEHVAEGDTLLSYQAAFDDDTANQLLKNLSMSADKISELGRNPVKSKYTGILEDIKIYRTVDMDELSPSLQKLVKMYEGPIKDKKKVFESYGIPTNTLPPTKKMDHTGKTKNVYDGVLIIFYIKYVDTMAIGDKIVFYSANKGTIKYLIPEGEEPYTDFRPKEHVDAFVSIGSINGRMVTSTILYGSIAKLMVELDRTCKDIAGIPYNENEL